MKSLRSNIYLATALLIAVVAVPRTLAADEKAEAVREAPTADVETPAESTPVESTPVESESATDRASLEAQAAKGPSLVFDSYEYDFGTVWKGGQELEHTFKVTNKGDQTYEILSVKPSCGCTVAGQHATILEPGETGEVPLKLKSSALHGNFRKRVAITSTDPGANYTSVELIGEVKEFYTMEPPSVYFGNLRQGDEAERTVKLQNQTDEPITLEMDASGLNAPFSAELIATEEGRAYDLVVKIAAQETESYYSGQIDLKPSDPKVETIRVSVAGRILPEIEVRPDKVILSQAFGRTMKRRLAVRNHNEEPVKLVSATSSSPLITVETQELAVGETFLVNLEVAPEWEPGDSETEIVLTFDNGKTINVPVIQNQPGAESTVLRPDSPAPPMPARITASKGVETKALTGEKLEATALEAKPLEAKPLEQPAAQESAKP